MPSDWVNKPVPFKRSDPLDAARYQFSRDLPNFAQTVKDMIDWMMAHGYRTFIVPSEQSFRNFTPASLDLFTDDDVEAIVEDEDQFL